MWLFWNGPETTPLQDLCRMYLWRFAIEHFFRFCKQHLGLNAKQSTDPVSIVQWMWVCSLALLAIAADAGWSRQHSTCLVSLRNNPGHSQNNPRTGAAGGFTIFSRFGYTGTSHPNRWKRKRSHYRLSSNTQNTVPGCKKGEIYLG